MGLAFCEARFSAKSFISHTYVPDRCKSFISTHIALYPLGWGYGRFDEMWCKALETRRIWEGVGEIACC